VQTFSVSPQGGGSPRIRKLRQLCSPDRLSALENGERHGDTAKLPVWYDWDDETYVTHFPPPDDFDGNENGLFGLPGYYRTLTDAEYAAIALNQSGHFADRRTDGQRRHAEWFGTVPGAGAEADAQPDEPPARSTKRHRARANA